MSEHRTGPRPHTEDPYTRLTSPRGIPVDQLVSVLQKDIRRGHADNAVLAAYEMLTTSPEVAEHMWHRLKVIAVEDIGLGEPLAPVLLDSLHENFRTATGGEQAMMAVHAVRFLAAAKKDRTSSEHTDLVIHGSNPGKRWSRFPTTPCASTPGRPGDGPGPAALVGERREGQQRAGNRRPLLPRPPA